MNTMAENALQKDSIDLEKQILYYFRHMQENNDSFFAQEAKNRGIGGILVKHLLNCNRLKETSIDEKKLLHFIESSEFFSLSSDISCSKKFKTLKTSKEDRTIIVAGIPYYPIYDQSKETVTSEFSTYKNQVIDWLTTEFSTFGCVLQFSKRSAVSVCIENIYTKKMVEEDFGQLEINKDTNEDFVIPVSAFTAKQAVTVALPLKTQYERRYIWSYAVITNGVDPMEQDEKLLEAKIMMNYGALDFKKLHIFPYSAWNTWKPKFYEWQSSWLTRFARKTRKLTHQRMKSEYHQVPPVKLEIPQRISKRTVFMGLEHGEELDEIISGPLDEPTDASRPKDFQPGSIAQFRIQFMGAPDGKQFGKLFKAMLPVQGLIHVDFEVDNELHTDLSLDASETFYFARFSTEQQCKTAVSNCR
ncbi:La- protein 7 [Cichlidogyrus casuarinus]|uniref:La- protein 7 n=1 Tax=Cichlidogyrus casuarinus TaxID=1844966 RepID=A0ABD2QPZ1_9PLAT